jgi:pimeloyl-ACP methyl ester carboxylesterase
VPIVGDFLRYTVSPLIMRVTADSAFEWLFSPQPVPRVFKDGFPLDLALRPEQIHAKAADAALMIPSIMRLRRRYSQVRLPSVVMAGSEDKVVDARRHALRLSRSLINSQLLIHPGQGHMLHFGVPHAVTDAVKSLSGSRDELAPVPPVREREFHAPA